jgi:hypothetical protein
LLLKSNISHFEAQNIYGTIENFATTLTSFSIDTEVPMAFGRHPPLSWGWEQRLSKALMISYSPLVTGNQSRLGGPRLCQAGLDSGGSTSAQTFMKLPLG